MTILSSSFLLLLFLLLAYITLHFPHLPTSSPIHSNRRALHQPFFPLTSTAIPPSQPPSPSLPRYPSSSSSSSSSSSIFGPFFPLYPSLPPPPPPPSTSSSSATSLPTFPANISSLGSPSRHSPSKLVPAVALPVLALLFVSLALLLLLHHRRRPGTAGNDARSDSLRFLTPDGPSDGHKPPAASSAGPVPAVSSEFLYLGTLVKPQGRASENSTATAPPAADGSSPELRPLPPLPPLPRQFVSGDCHRSSSSEEGYSPPVDPPCAKERAAAAASQSSSSKKEDGDDRMERSGSRSSARSTLSYLSSNMASSPSQSPPPRPPLRPPTPSPPKRRPPSHSPPSSPPHVHVDNEKKAEAPQASGHNLWTPRKIGDFASRNPPPPPPPPPPRAVHKVDQNSNLSSLRPPVLIPPKGIAETLKSSDASEKWEENPRPKLKPLHWDKVRASSDRAMVWDQLKSSSFQLNEEEIETLFVCNTTNTSMKDINASKLSPSLGQGNMVLDPKKSQNIAILLRALNVTKEEVCEALLEGKVDRFSNELLDALSKMVPSKEEELKLKEYKDDSSCKLGPAESFLKAVLDLPFAFQRVDAMVYIVNFDTEVNHLRNLFETLEAACKELRNNRIFHKLLGAVLKTGNRMNIGTTRGDAQAFKLDTLLKLVDIKGTDGRTSFLHFVVQEIVRAEGLRLSSSNGSVVTQTNMLADAEFSKLGLLVVSRLGDELVNVKKAAAMDSDMLRSFVSKLTRGIGKVQEVLRLNDAFLDKNGRRFHDAMVGFLKKAEGEILEIQEQESVALSLVKETTEYFHGDSAKEAHPFRIFMVVRDFLAILDQVCKEVEKIYDCNIKSVADRSRLSLNQTSQSAFPRLHAGNPGSSDDESSSSSS